MISFAVRIRDNLPERLLLSDAEVAHRLGVARSTIWSWVDAGEFPPPKRVGKARRSDGKHRACRSFWHREDIELFARCRSMAEFTRLKRRQEQS
jgi:predicted DNA-binding transcriptional regulator AlpA